ncbi:hypothetical protein N7462_008800 [Penicillium macrosclerotiorum]|uniref:uncharacterized protein n=1 Tax=Penicillium macrosclerotiorum TaxID=303699 RepID=UPI002548BBAA|nr:uncharacterized protein N7462_008800 [Penicillium macrosclerotiorum]KAJ5675903.1 hypothetical protein N7462_008800 [Penicillium macrosclerotiorum]
MVRQLGQDSRPSLQSATRSRPFRILDLCTGTGCIALLLHALLSPHLERCQILGIDISPKALSLARRNLDHNIRSDCLDRRASFDVQFHQADVLLETANGSIPTVEEIVSNSFPYQSIPDKPPTESGCDLLISNPPYISTSDFRDGTTARSVRLFEPRLALIPPASNHPGHKSDRHEDIFYRRILALSLKLAAKITLLECGDLQQAQRVVRMHNQMRGSTSGLTAEIWPSQEEDLAANGFHAHEGSRCVIIHNLARKAE